MIKPIFTLSCEDMRKQDKVGRSMGSLADIRINRAIEAEGAAQDDQALMPVGTVFAAGANGDERRMQVRAYNYWLSLAQHGELPAIEDLRPEDHADLGPSSVVLDLTLGRENPSILYIGAKLAEACGTADEMFAAGDVPGRSLLARLTEHGLEVVANRAPVGFDSEFVDSAGRAILYRSILLPFSSDGRTIDFLFGVISWKEDERHAAPAPQLVAAPPAPPIAPPPVAEPALAAAPADQPVPQETLRSLLALARGAAAAARDCHERSRAALYAAISGAYDFALASEHSPAELDRLLDDAGLSGNHPSLALMLVKLVFGSDYDKTRLSEYAAVLDHARCLELRPGTLAEWLAQVPGGLRAVVADERRLRRIAAGKPAQATALRAATQRRLRTLPALEAQIETGGEFVLLVARRDFHGRLTVLGAANDGALLDRAARRLLAS